VPNSAPFSFSALPGTYTLTDVADSGAAVQFTLNPNGTVSYAANLEGILTGTGTANMTVKGRTATLDLRPLSLPYLVLDSDVVVHNSAPFAFTGLPGTYTLWDSVGSGATVQFSLNPSGTVSYAANLEGILTGTGTTTLTVKGRTATLDARGFSQTFLSVNNDVNMLTTAPFAFTALPGTYTLGGVGRPDTDVLFTLNANGTVGYDPTLQGMLTGTGTTTLTVKGRTVTIDARALSIPNLILDNQVLVHTTALFSYTSLPGTYTLTDAANSTASVQFTLNPNGTVGYDATLQGILAGTGTTTLAVKGETVQIDARAHAAKAATFTVSGITGLATSAVQTLHLLPGMMFFSSGTLQFFFTLDNLDQVSVDPTLAAAVRVLNKNMLVVQPGA
jgi:hypothetical protein